MAVELPLDLCCDFFSEFDTNKRVVFILVLLCVCTNIYEIVVCVFHSAAVYLNSSIGIFLLSWHVVWGGPYRGRFVNEHYVRLPISNRGYERYFFFFFRVEVCWTEAKFRSAQFSTRHISLPLFMGVTAFRVEVMSCCHAVAIEGGGVVAMIPLCVLRFG